VRHMLIDRGHEPILAENGAVGLMKLKSHRPDAILLDLVMPVIDGFEFLEDLQSRGDPTPAIVLTADIQDSVREICEELGARDFLNKPIQAKCLERVLAPFLPKEAAG